MTSEEVIFTLSESSYIVLVVYSESVMVMDILASYYYDAVTFSALIQLLMRVSDL